MCKSNCPYRRGLSVFVYCMTVLAASPVLAGDSAAASFLLISPSPEANAMGGTYANTAFTSPMAVMFNPASLGFFSQRNFFGVASYPSKVAWLPAYGEDLNFDAKSTCFGLTVPTFARIPLSLGLAFHNSQLNLGTQYITTESSPEPIAMANSWEEYKGTTFSVAVEYYLRASFGYTYKTVESHLAGLVAGSESGQGQASVKAHDIGFLLELPVFEALKKSKLIRNSSIHGVEPILSLGYCYSKTNIGDKISYYDATAGDALPRNLSLGVHLQAGLTYKSRYQHTTLMSFKWAREVEDLLVQYKPDGGFAYAAGLHQIKFWENVVAGKSNENIMARRGYEINLLDFYFIRRGNMEDLSGMVRVNTKGWGVDFIQPLKIVAALLHLDQNRYVKLLAHCCFEQNCSEYQSGGAYPLQHMKFKNLVFRFQNLPLAALF